MPGAPAGGIRLPVAPACRWLESAGRVKGGAAAELCEGTLDPPEHSGGLEAAMGDRHFSAMNLYSCHRIVGEHSFIEELA